MLFHGILNSQQMKISLALVILKVLLILMTGLHNKQVIAQKGQMHGKTLVLLDIPVIVAGEKGKGVLYLSFLLYSPLDDNARVVSVTYVSVKDLEKDTPIEENGGHLHYNTLPSDDTAFEEDSVVDNSLQHATSNESSDKL